MVVSSQIQTLPTPQNLPFRLISRTIGQGAYAFIRKACPQHAAQPVIAVKFIHKEHAFKVGRLKPKQLQSEVALHQHVGAHTNIVHFLGNGEDHVWTWIAMELAEGDLFDKIEPDDGIGEEIAHFYFTQLISAVSYMHSRGVAHRDIKPENILLADGDLKLADFGLAVLYGYKGEKKLCTTACGSPPYMAPEVVPVNGFAGGKTTPYEANKADIWSCGVVLFVLLVGNTPWDEPTMKSPEFADYCDHGPVDELWSRIPHNAISLLKGILSVDPASRFSLEEIRRHPWYTQHNRHLAADGRAANPVGLATQMLQNLRIDFNADPFAASQRPSATQSQWARIDEDPGRLALTQPETPVTDTMTFDWEQPARVIAEGYSASQPTGGVHRSSSVAVRGNSLCAAQRYPASKEIPDIVPEHSLARFLSFMDFGLLIPLISESLSRLGIAAPAVSAAVLAGHEHKAYIPLKTRDQRNQMLAGTITVERIDEEVLEVRFLKVKGDPLEWRRLFKKVAILCKDGILRPEA